MPTNPMLIELATRLLKAAEMVRTRIPEDGPISGWSGFHMDLDQIDDLTRRLRLGARGIFESEEEPSKAGGSDA